MKPSCFIRTVTRVFLVWGVVLLGCDPGVVKFQEAIQQTSPIIQALATAIEKNLKASILDQAFDFENSTRVVFTPGGTLSASQSSLISPAAAVALMAQDTVSQTSSSKILDSLLGAVLLCNMLTDSFASLPSDRKVSVKSGEFVIDGQRMYTIKKIESRKGFRDFISRIQIVLTNSSIGEVKMTAYTLGGGIRYVSFFIKKSSHETFFIEALGKLKQDGLVVNLLNYEVKNGHIQMEDRYESKAGLSPVSLITNQLLSGSSITVEEILDLSQSDDTTVAELINQILSERNDSNILDQAMDWENSSRFTLTRDKPLSASQKKLVPLIALTALLGKDVSQVLDTGKTKEISMMLAEAIGMMYSQMTAMPSANASITQGKVMVDGSSDFKFESAEFTKKNGKSSVSIEFKIPRRGKLTLEVNVPAHGSPSAEFKLDDPSEDKFIKMKAYSLGNGANLPLSRFTASISKGSNLESAVDISKSSGVSVDDLIKNHLLAGNLVNIQDILNLFQREEPFAANIEGSQGDFTDLNRFNLGSGTVEFDGDTVTFKYHPGEVEFVVMGERNGDLIAISPTSIPDSTFSDSVYGDCALINGEVEGNCTVVNENTLDCSFFIQGVVTDSEDEGSCHKAKSDTTVVIQMQLTAQ